MGAENSTLNENEKKSIQESIKCEIDDLRYFVEKLDWQKVKGGDWFTLLLKTFLRSHAEKVSIDYFMKKYPGIPLDAIGDRLISQAVFASSIAGGFAGASVSVATLTSAISAGATITGGIAALLTEMAYTTRLQMRLVYDLSLLYHKQINTEDPEDLMEIFSLALGIKTLERGGKVIKGLAPEAVRAQVRRATYGHTKAIQAGVSRVLGPKIGGKITQRSIIRTAVPAVGIGISIAWNYYSTKSIAKIAKAKFRAKGIISEEFNHIIDKTKTADIIILQSSVMAAQADGKWDKTEVEAVTLLADKLDLSEEERDSIEKSIHYDRTKFFNQLAQIEDQDFKQLLMEVMVLVSTSDQHLHKKELAFLEEAAKSLNLYFDKKGIKKYIKSLYQN